MKYVIQSMIIFDTTEYILTSLTDSNKSIKLSNAAGRVLKELIELRKTDTPVTREHLFSIVWRTHGLEPSNGNLNQQISLIRKTLSSFGIGASSIITIPKRGLKFNNQLIVEKINEEKKPYPSYSPASHITQEQNDHLSSPILLNIKNHIKYMIALIITTIVILSASFIYLYNKKDNIKLYCCKEINSCNICSLHADAKIDCSNCTIIQCSTKLKTQTSPKPNT